LLLREWILNCQWNWYTQFYKEDIISEIIKITSPSDIEVWLHSDPLCNPITCNNQLLDGYENNNVLIEGRKFLLSHDVLWGFILARVEARGYIKLIRKPICKICPLCGQEFVEDSLAIPLINRLGIQHIDYCAPCLCATIFQGTGNNYLSAEQIKKYLLALTEMIGRVPSQYYGEGKSDLLNLNPKERLALLKLLKGKPSVNCVKRVFGSWLNALIKVGVLEDGTRKTSRGIQTIAKDGHICRSLGEKTIDEFLFANGIAHEREPRYPESNYRGDFIVGDIIIEYFGLTGNPEYDNKSEEKKNICKRNGIILIAIYPEDLVTDSKLINKMSILNRELK
jgi:hypothetical protein